MMKASFVDRRTVACAAVVSIALGSCTFLQPKPDPTRYYVLAPLSPRQADVLRGATEPRHHELSVGVGPIRFPEYLRKAQLVTRVAANRLEVSQIDRWAEPPDADFTRVLANNVGVLLETDRILVFPWYGTPRLDYRVSAEVMRFEGTADREVLLHARWALYSGGADRPPLEVRESELQEPLTGKGTEASVEALSRVLGRFSAEVASSIRRHAPPR